MRKTIAALVVLGLAWFGYISWPLYDLTVLVRAIDARDVSTVVRYVNFDRVRASLIQQIASAYMQRSGIQSGPLAQQAVIVGLSVADPVINKLVSPEALADLLTVGWPVGVVPDPPPSGSLGISTGDARNCLADLCCVSLWHWPVRSGGADSPTARTSVSADVPSASVALATGWHHPSREHSELTRG